MTDASTQTTDPTLAMAERQLAELADMAMAASRAFTSSAMALAVAEKRILNYAMSLFYAFYAAAFGLALRLTFRAFKT